MAEVEVAAGKANGHKYHLMGMDRHVLVLYIEHMFRYLYCGVVFVGYSKYIVHVA